MIQNELFAKVEHLEGYDAETSAGAQIMAEGTEPVQAAKGNNSFEDKGLEQVV